MKFSELCAGLVSITHLLKEFLHIQHPADKCVPAHYFDDIQKDVVPTQEEAEVGKHTLLLLLLLLLFSCRERSRDPPKGGSKALVVHGWHSVWNWWSAMVYCETSLVHGSFAVYK